MVVVLQQPPVVGAEDPGVGAEEEGGQDNGPVAVDFCSARDLAGSEDGTECAELLVRLVDASTDGHRRREGGVVELAEVPDGAEFERHGAAVQERDGRQVEVSGAGGRGIRHALALGVAAVDTGVDDGAELHGDKLQHSQIVRKGRATVGEERSVVGLDNVRDLEGPTKGSLVPPASSRGLGGQAQARPEA